MKSSQKSVCRKGFLQLCLIVGTAVSLQAEWLTIHNDFDQYDLDGNAIRTRSGCLSKFGETYYWYGCDGGMTNQTCYSSKDLLHWKNHGNMLTATRGTNRMDVIYNDSTKKYVMILKWETPDANIWCNRGIATSDSPTGPFTKLFDSTVYGKNTGDMSVFQDDDGKAYYCYEIWDKDLNKTTAQVLALMTWDYINLEKKIQTWSDGNREAEMIMKNHGIYYYMTSGMMGIDPTETRYWTSRSINGPWTTNLVSVIAPGDADRKSWDTQCDYVFAFKGTKDTMQMYCGDRWVRPHPARCGDYVWLPITFTQKDSVVIDYYQDWEVEPTLGLWRTIDSKRNLALEKTATASSSNGSNTPGNVTSPATWQNYLNTKWESAQSDPQWITVDLGAEMKVNRVILKWDSAYAKAFKIQLSKDNTAWDDVFSTTKNGARSVTDETFTTATARYVRMYGTQRGNTSKGYGLFDFMVLNDSLPQTSVKMQQNSLCLSKPALACSNNRVLYSLTSGKNVKIEIVDSRGRMVSVLVNGFKNAGKYEVVLPHSLGSGMFIVRMVSGRQKLSAMQVKL